MATKSVKTAGKPSKTSAPKVSRARSSDKKSDTVTSAAEAETQPSADLIAARAYELWCARGFGHGHDVEDWLAAERDLKRS